MPFLESRQQHKQSLEFPWSSLPWVVFRKATPTTTKSCNILFFFLCMCSDVTKKCGFIIPHSQQVNLCRHWQRRITTLLNPAIMCSETVSCLTGNCALPLKPLPATAGPRLVTVSVCHGCPDSFHVCSCTPASGRTLENVYWLYCQLVTKNTNPSNHVWERDGKGCAASRTSPGSSWSSESSHLVSLETSSMVFRASVEASWNADYIKVNLRFLFDPEVGQGMELEVPIIKSCDWFPW